MSFTTGTNTELLWASRTAGTALATFTAEASIIAGITEGPAGCAIPAGFFSANGGVGKIVKVEMNGIWSATATPSFTWTLRLVTAAGALVATTTALPVTAITNVEWKAEIDIICTAVGPTTTAQARVNGMLWTRTTAVGAATVSQNLFFGGGSAAGTPTPATPTLLTGFDSTISNAIVPSAICTVSSASNAIQLTAIRVLGIN